MYPLSMMVANFVINRVYTVRNIKLFCPRTGNVYLELLCRSIDTFTMMCTHRNSTIKYNEFKVTGVHNETFLKCRQKYRIHGYMNMINGYIGGYIYGSSWNPDINYLAMSCMNNFTLLQNVTHNFHFVMV